LTATTTTTLNDIVGTHIVDAFFGFQQPDLRLVDDAKKYPVPRGAGKTIRFPVMRPLDRITTSTNEGSNPTAVALSTDKKEESLTKYTNAVEVTMESWSTGIKALSKQVGRELRKNYNRSLTYLIMQKLARSGNRTRIDLNTSYQEAGTPDGTPTTIEIIDAGLATTFGTNDTLTGGMCIITSGPGAGGVARISDHTGSTGNMVVSGIDVAPTTSSTIKVVTTAGLDASNPFNTDAFIHAGFVLSSYSAPKTGGAIQYHVNLDPAMWADLLTDDVFRRTGMYHDKERLNQAKLGLWHGIEIGVDTEGWKEVAATQADGETEMGDYSSSGAVHNAWFYSKGAFGCAAVANRGEGVGSVKFYNIMEPDSNNNTLAYTTHSWEMYQAAAVPYGLWVLGIACGSAHSAAGDNI
jgi:hypothetical protein